MAALNSGQLAESVAQDYLIDHGYKILSHNWKTDVCEIDIVAEKSKRIYFVEVKYRASNAQGFGLDYITKTKLKQMKFAAEVWVKNKNWLGDYSLAAIEVSGSNYTVSSFEPDLT